MSFERKKHCLHLTSKILNFTFSLVQLDSDKRHPSLLCCFWDFGSVYKSPTFLLIYLARPRLVLSRRRPGRYFSSVSRLWRYERDSAARTRCNLSCEYSGTRHGSLNSVVLIGDNQSYVLPRTHSGLLWTTRAVRTQKHSIKDWSVFAESWRFATVHHHYHHCYYYYYHHHHQVARMWIIYCCFQQWKNLKNRLTFHEVIATIRHHVVLRHSV